MAYPTVNDLKDWLRITPNPSFEPDELDSLLASLLAAAIDHVESATANTFATDTPERISTAIKFLAGTWFENPVPDSKMTESAIGAVDILIAAYRNFSFPG
jgi:hypothetical protein